MLTPFRISTLRWVVAACLMLAVVLSILMSYQTTTKVKALGQEWSGYQKINAQKFLIVEEIEKAVGDDGIVHHVRAYLKQGDRQEALDAHHHLMELQIALTAFRNLGLSDQEKRALTQLEHDIERYKGLLIEAEQADQPPTNRASTHPTLSVLQTSVWQSIRSLEAYLYAEQKRNYASLHGSIEALSTFSYVVGSSSVLILLILGAVFFTFINKNLIHPLNQLIASFESISPDHPGDRRLEVTSQCPKNELGKLITVANRFIDSVQVNQEQRNLAEQNLRRSEQHLKVILQHAADAIITIDDAGLLTSFNAAAEEMFGYRADEVMGKNVALLMPEPYHSQHDQYLKNYHHHQTSKVIGAGRGLKARKKDGSIMPIRLAVSEIDSEVAHGFTGIITDLTETIRFEEQKQAKEMAERANRAKSEFLSSMSHELRTPLNSIIGFAQLLNDGSNAFSTEQVTYLKYISESGEHLLSLISDILDLSKVEAGKIQFSYKKVEAALLLNECIHLCQVTAAEHQVSIIHHADDHLPELYTDYLRAKQIILNLISNAIKYNRDQGTVVISTKMQPDAFLRISIRDTGIGIPEDALEQVFQPFNRLHQEGGDIEGTGIGLAISQKLVLEMGGHIGVQSTLGEGSTFWIELPTTEQQEITATDDTDNNQAPPHCLAHPACRLLYIEDNEANATLMESVLKSRTNIQFLTSKTAHEGIKMAETLHPDIILMDINLPDINGFDAAAYLKESPDTQTIPIIALSANAMADAIAQGEQTELFECYLTKPFDVPLLLQALEQALAKNVKTRVDIS